MVVLRATQKLLPRLPAPEAGARESDTALGDWYVNRLVVDRQPLLLLLSSRSLLPVILPARDVRNLPRQLPNLIAARLRRLDVPDDLIIPELAAMAPVVIGRTISRSVVGVMVDFAKLIPLHLEPGAWDENTLAQVEAQLARTPCHASSRDDEVIWPDRDTPALLAAHRLPAGPSPA